MFDRKELKAKGKAAFKNNYWPAVVAALVLGIAEASSSGSAGGSNQQISEATSNMDPAVVGIIVAIILVAVLFSIALKVFVMNPLSVGGYKFFVENRKEKAELSLLGFGFKNNYMGNVKTLFMRDLYVFLWTLLFIVPGIVKGYEYRMIPYILADNPEVDTKEAFELTKGMMTGNKWASFVLDFSFIGWAILTIFTLGILGVFYVNPYIYATDAELYATLSGKDQKDAETTFEVESVY